MSAPTAQDLLNQLCLTVQRAVGQGDGGYAGQFWCGDDAEALADLLERYIAHERANAPAYAIWWDDVSGGGWTLEAPGWSIRIEGERDRTAPLEDLIRVVRSEHNVDLPPCTSDTWDERREGWTVLACEVNRLWAYVTCPICQADIVLSAKKDSESFATGEYAKHILDRHPESIGTGPGVPYAPIRLGHPS